MVDDKYKIAIQPKLDKYSEVAVAYSSKFSSSSPTSGSMLLQIGNIMSSKYV